MATEVCCRSAPRTDLSPRKMVRDEPENFSWHRPSGRCFRGRKQRSHTGQKPGATKSSQARCGPYEKQDRIISMETELIRIITSADPTVRDLSLDAFARAASIDELIAECAALNAFRRKSDNLYE